MRTTYTGPVKNRGENAQGKANVSREELADFKRKYGADKTLRDLLNADKTGKAPASEKSPMARGSQGANIEPSRVSMSPARREAMDRASENARKREEGKKAVTERQEAAAARGMDRLKSAGLTPGSTTLGQSLGAAAGMAAPPALRAASAAPKVASMASKAGEAAKGAMSKAGDAVKGAMSKAGEAAPRAEPRVGRPVTSKLDEAAAAFSRPQARQVSKDTGYTREPSKTTPPQPTRAPKPRDEVLKRQAAMREGRKATEDYARDVMERGAEMGYKKGGSVKGSGCETRGKKARYI
jgi:hypothetical protein